MERGREESFTGSSHAASLVVCVGVCATATQALVSVEKGTKISTDITLMTFWRTTCFLGLKYSLKRQHGCLKKAAHPFKLPKRLRSDVRGIFSTSSLLLNRWQTRQICRLWTTAFSQFRRKKLALKGSPRLNVMVVSEWIYENSNPNNSIRNRIFVFERAKYAIFECIQVRTLEKKNTIFERIRISILENRFYLNIFDYSRFFWGAQL